MDTERIKRNIGKMLDAGAPEQEIDAYISSEGVTMDQLNPGFGKRLDQELSSVPRQLGLTARHAVEAPFEMAGTVSNPIAATINKATGSNLMSAGDLGSWLADKLRLPSPETPRERLAGTGGKMMLSLGFQAGLASKAAQTAQGVGKGVAESLAANPAAQLTGAAGGGLAGEYTKETGGGPGAQFAAALTGSFLGAGSAMLAGKVADGLSTLTQALKGQKLNTVDVNLKINAVLSESGLTISDIPSAARAGLVKEMQEAIKMGRPVNPKVVQRLAEYGRVGAQPTRGTLTLDPAQITKEKNIAKFGAMSQDDNLAAMARMQRENELKLINNLNQLGAGAADDPIKAGEKIMTSLKAIDKPRSDTVDAAYQAVRDSSGRHANLDVPAFSKLANDALDEKMLGSALPKEAKALLNDVSSGKIPLTVNTMAQLDKRLSGIAYDTARSSKEGAKAVSKVRTALHETPIESTAGNTARGLYEKFGEKTLSGDREKSCYEGRARQ